MVRNANGACLAALAPQYFTMPPLTFFKQCIQGRVWYDSILEPERHALVVRQVKRQLSEALDAADANRRLSEPADLAAVLDGKALQIMLRPEHKAALLKLGMQCKVRRDVMKYTLNFNRH